MAIALRINGTNVVNAFFYPGTVGVLSMLIAYFVIQIGAVKFLHVENREPRWRAIIIALAAAAIVYTFYKQVWPKPAYPVRRVPAAHRGLGADRDRRDTLLPGAYAPDRQGPVRV